MSNGNGSRIVRPGAFQPRPVPVTTAMMDIGINPDSLMKFKATMLEMRKEAEVVLKVVERALEKAKELEAVKNALSNG